MMQTFRDREEKEAVINHYRGKIRVIDEQIENLEKERKLHSLRIDELTPEGSFDAMWNNVMASVSELYTNGYSKDFTLVIKTKYVLLNNAKIICSTREIANYINQLEGNLLTESGIKDLVNKLGATLKQKVDKGELFQRTESDNGEYLYGLINWFYPGGKVKQPYINTKHRLKQITSDDNTNNKNIE